MADKRLRLRYEFWFDLNNALENYLAERVADLKTSRLFKPFIRDGLRLMLSLKDGDVSVLRELFPQIVDKIEKEHHSAELLRLNGELENLRAALQAGPVAKPARHASDESAEPEIVAVKNTSTDATQNFLNSLMGIQNLGG